MEEILKETGTLPPFPTNRYETKSNYRILLSVQMDREWMIATKAYNLRRRMESTPATLVGWITANSPGEDPDVEYR
jgi:hypothetical protein